MVDQRQAVAEIAADVAYSVAACSAVAAAAAAVVASPFGSGSFVHWDRPHSLAEPLGPADYTPFAAAVVAAAAVAVACNLDSVAHYTDPPAASYS